MAWYFCVNGILGVAMDDRGTARRNVFGRMRSASMEALGERSLTRRLLVLVVLSILVAEVLFYVPSVAAYRNQWLAERLNAALIASLALDVTPDHRLPENLRAELLARAGVIAVSRKDEHRRALILAADLPVPPAAFYDLDTTDFLGAVGQTAETLLAGDGRIIRVAGTPAMRSEAGSVIDIVIAETPLRHALLAYSSRMFWISLALSGLTAALIFTGFNRILIRPIARLIWSMLRFREAPEDAGRVIVPSARADEIGAAERALASMQEELRAALSHKTRLAALGTAMSKINHDLRNMLATAQLVSDRLAASQDPAVQREAPKLMRALDRAIMLTTETLRYGRNEEPAPQPRRFRLADVVDEVASALPLALLRFENRVDGSLLLEADPDQVYRILLNLTRNAVEALTGRDGVGGMLVVEGRRGSDGGIIIEVSDDGPGIPARIRTHLFEPFASARADSVQTPLKPSETGGTGLGLAISRELARAHGGDIMLVRSDPAGTVFRVILPDRAHFH
jgi:signal transduction histidine kinase